MINHQKRELSGESNPEEDCKKVREGTSVASACNDSIEEEVFQQETGTNIAEILVMLKNLEAKVSEIYNISSDTKAIQIKGDKQLAELAESVQHMSDRFDEFERECKEKEKIITDLIDEVDTLRNRVETLENECDSQEQYSRRNCLLVHGLEENKDESTDDLVLSVFQEKMNIEFTDKDMDRSHRIGKAKPGKKRPIIVKFVRYNDRKKVFSNKKRLKNSGISITESLTAFRMDVLSKAREKHGFKNVWTIDGRIMFKGNDNKPKKFYG